MPAMAAAADAWQICKVLLDKTRQKHKRKIEKHEKSKKMEKDISLIYRPISCSDVHRNSPCPGSGLGECSVVEHIRFIPSYSEWRPLGIVECSKKHFP
jgi:hypothetical protein